MPLTTFISLLLIVPHTLHALQFDINARRRSVFARDEGITLNNSADISYHADLVLGGQSFQVLIDTGSSDLWVAGNVQQSTDTGLTSGVNYAIGRVKGPIKTGRLELAGYTVDNQAFLQIPPSSENQAGSGILGLGPAAGSFILAATQNASGAPVLDRIFLQNTSIPAFFTILLGRQRDPSTFFSGTITIGSVHSDYPQILSEPHLPIKLVSQENLKNQHFQIALDKDGIIGPNGQPISVESTVVEDSGPIAVLDCGFSLPQVPRSVADAIYGRFREAEFTSVSGIGGIWVLPCEQEVNVTFVFNGTQYPMHPLDMSLHPEVFGMKNVTNSNGTPLCLGSFQPFTYERGSEPSYDIVLGMAFMRSVYTLFDYSDFLLSTSTPTDPYIQMLSLVDRAQAHLDFVKARLGGIDTTGQTTFNNAPATNPSRSVNSSVLVYVLAAVAVIIVIIVAAVWLTCRMRKAKARKAGAS